MNQLLASFWQDEQGVVVSAEIVTIATVSILTAVTGFGLISDALSSEFRDLSGAMTALNQSYRFTGFRGCKSFVSGSQFSDDGGGSGSSVNNGLAELIGGGAPFVQLRSQPGPNPQIRVRVTESTTAEARTAPAAAVADTCDDGGVKVVIPPGEFNLQFKVKTPAQTLPVDPKTMQFGEFKITGPCLTAPDDDSNPFAPANVRIRVKPLEHGEPQPKEEEAREDEATEEHSGPVLRGTIRIPHSEGK